MRMGSMSTITNIGSGGSAAALMLQLALHLQLHLVAAFELRPCNGSLLTDCYLNQECVENNGQFHCQCQDGYVFDSNSKTENEECTKFLPATVSPPVESSGSATTVVVTLLCLSLITCALVLAVRRYNLINWLRQKLTRRENSVMYEDVMIGQDDPPIAA